MIKGERKEWDIEGRIKKQPLNSRHDKRRKKGMGQRRKNVRSRRRPLLEMKISMKKRMIEWLSRSE
jgi:hypothetical protein